MKTHLEMRDVSLSTARRY